VTSGVQLPLALPTRLLPARLRIRRLRLQNWTHFGTKEITFAAEHNLHVVFGPNEAGKSSLLRAVELLLFGPGRGEGGSWGPTARVEAVLERGLDELQVSRLLAKKAELQGASEPLLDISRDEFLSSFGLNLEGLRAGSQALAESGSLGSAILSASGSHNPESIVATLERQASALYKKRGHKQPIHEKLEAYRKFEHERKSSATSAHAFAEQEAGLCENAEAQVQIEASLEAVRRDLVQTRLMLKLAGPARRSTELSAARARLPQTVLSQEDATECEAQLRLLSTAERDLADGEHAKSVAVARLAAGQTQAHAFAEIERDMQTLESGAETLCSARERRVAQARLAQSKGEQLALLQARWPDLSPAYWSLAPTAARELETVLAACQRAEQQCTERSQSVEQLTQELKQRRAHTEAEAKGANVAALSEAQRMAKDYLARMVSEGTLRDLEAAAEAANAKYVSAKAQLAERWPAAAPIDPKRFPHPSHIADWFESSARLDAAKTSAEQQLQILSVALEQLDAEANTLRQKDAALPSRAHWLVLRDYRNARIASEAVVSHLDAEEVAAACAEADAYAQALIDAAERAAHLNNVERELALTRSKVAQAEALFKTSADLATDLQTKIRAFFPPELRQESVASLRQLATEVQLALPLETEAAQARQALSLTQAKLRASVQRFAPWLAEATDLAELAFEQILSLCRQREERLALQQEHAREREQKRNTLETVLGREQVALEAETIELNAARSALAKACSALGLDEKQVSLAVLADVRAWQQLEADHKQLSDSMAELVRTTQMLEASFLSVKSALAKTMGEDWNRDRDLRKQIASALRAWKEEEARRSRRAEAETHLREAALLAEQARGRVHAAETALLDLGKRYALSSVAGLTERLAHTKAARALEAESLQVQATLEALMPSERRDAWLLQLGATDEDALEAKVESLVAEEARLTDALTAARRRQIAFESGRQMLFEARANSASAAQQAELALAEARALAEDYLALRLAASLVRKRATQFAKAHEGAVLAHASELFACITGGAFTGLTATRGPQAARQVRGRQLGDSR
jgi:chromosome segregation protein